MDNKKFKICMMIDAWNPIVGGGQIHVEKLTQYLIDKHHCQIDLFVRDLPGNTDQNITVLASGLRVIKVGPKGNFFNPVFRLLWLFSSVLSVLKQNKKQHYNLIHAHAYFAGIPAKFLSLILKIPVVFTVHGSNLIDQGSQSLARKIEEYLLLKIHYNKEISVSSNFLKYKNNNQVVVIPNGVDLKIFDQVKASNSPNNFIILFVGRFDKVKGVDVLLQSIKKLSDNNPELISKNHIVFNLVGYGYEEENLKKLAIELKISHLVNFLGKKSQKETILEYKRSSLFVLPSLAEGQPITLLEAWAAKLPVVATNTGDNARFIKNNTNGYLVKPADPEALFQALKKAVQNKNIKELGEKGYAAVRKFTWSEISDQTMAVYEEVIK